MLGKIRQMQKSIYDGPIDKVLQEMQEYSPDSPEYRAAIEHLDTLSKLKAQERSTRVSADTRAIVLGNLLGILVIVAYEQKHVMTTRAQNFTIKPK